MKQRQRKFAGMIACIAFLTVYCLIAMAIGAVYAVGSHGLVEAAYFIVAGVAWLPPVMLIVRWMSRPNDENTNDDL